MRSSDVTIEPIEVDGHPCLLLDAGGPRVAVTIDVGPRILSVTLPDGTGEGLLASLPALTIDRPGWPRFPMLGGHRLWAAPEIPETTYLPDAGPVEVEQGSNGVSFTWSEPGPRLRRTMTVTPAIDSVRVDHRLANEGGSPLRVAPWAITMLTTGGEAWLPRFAGASDAHGLQANGSIVLWPYTRLSDDRLVVDDDPVVRLRAVGDAPGPVKVGLQGRPGWSAYRREGAVFVKRAVYQEGADYPDLGASAQVYTNADFIEVETLGPLVTLEPGGSTDHREVWSLHAVDPGLSMTEVRDRLGLT